VRQACLKLEGTFGIVVLHRNHPDQLIGVRRGSPLLVGFGKAGTFLGSDVMAFSGKADKVIYLEENNLVEINRKNHKVITLDKRVVASKQHPIAKVDMSGGLQGYSHYMAKEIHLQPESILDSLRGRLLVEDGNALLNGLNLVKDQLRKIDRIIFVACGTSWHAALTAEYMIEETAGIPCEVEYASEFRYRNPVVRSNTLVFAISQSGETADTLAAIQEAKSRGATVLGICNGVGSSIARITDGGIYLHAGPEIGVASTKAFTSQVTVLALLTLLLGRMRRLSHAQGMEIANCLKKIPGQIKSILRQEPKIKEIAKEYAKAKNFLYLGRAINFPSCFGRSIKIKRNFIYSCGRLSSCRNEARPHCFN